MRYARTVGLPLTPPARLNLYVPHPESRLCIELTHGSAIVGLPLASGGVLIYFEGNLIGAKNLRRYRDKASQAAIRMLHKYPVGYPTKARDEVDPREVIEIGNIETNTDRLQITARPADFSWWIDPADLADLGLTSPSA